MRDPEVRVAREHGAHVSDGRETAAREDVTLDEVDRTTGALVLAIGDGDGLQQHGSVGRQHLRALAEKHGLILVPHGLDHLDRHELVEGSLQVPVVLEQEGYAIGEAGAVYRGTRISALMGSYVFADYVSGNVWALRANGTNFVGSSRLTGDAGIAEAVVGNRVGDVSHAIQVLVEGAGFCVFRSLVGHGVGREMHEPPHVPNFGRPGIGFKLKAGMVLALEPMFALGRPETEEMADHWTVRMRDGSLLAIDQ